MKRAIAMAMLALLIISACGCVDGETTEISNNGRAVFARIWRRRMRHGGRRRQAADMSRGNA